jgi:hypothetical protein
MYTLQTRLQSLLCTASCLTPNAADLRIALQAGLYMLNVTLPSTVSDVAVLGSPLAVDVMAGDPVVNNSHVLMVAPSSPVLGSVVTARILLQDQYNNSITQPGQGQYNITYLNIAIGMLSAARRSAYAFAAVISN